MNRKHQNDMQIESGEYAVRRSRRTDIIAAVVCIFLALVIWAVVMNVDDTADIPLVIEGTSGESYVLSDDAIEVKGKILNLKRAEKVGVIVPEEWTEGTHALTLEDLVFPEGVSPSEVVDITVTVVKP